nr:immunoglobulin light chain junction region [Macaca mulatta]
DYYCSSTDSGGNHVF